MAKRNVKTNEESVEQPQVDVQPVQETTANTDIAQTATTQPEVNEETHQIESGQGDSEQTDGEGDPELDTEPSQEEIGQKGSDDVDTLILGEPVETTENRNRIAKDVFDKNPQCKILHFTADLIPFFSKSDAFRHGSNTLKNDTIVTINRK
ncbi:hypothetical protein [Limibacterium fermenti]|uniref:hypothetical protein n=1 Tax=Limibacterium fermenti TaxID=3229863 RepID=UPI000E93464A|nr:hypothetical protein [Porphyromonadaceae bacterium]